MDYNLLKVELLIEQSQDEYAIKVMEANKELFDAIKDVQLISSKEAIGLLMFFIFGFSMMSLFFYQIDIIPLAIFFLILTLLMFILFYIYYKVIHNYFENWLCLCKESDIKLFNDIIIKDNYKIIKDYDYHHKKFYRVICLGE